MIIDLFPFYVDFFFLSSPTRLLPELTMRNTVFFNKNQEVLTLREYMDFMPFYGIRVTNRFSFPCCVVLLFCCFYFILLVFILCRVPNVAFVSGLSILDCSFGFL